jgi:HAD superfamily hydrolase (TIGR01509 family)
VSASGAIRLVLFDVGGVLVELGGVRPMLEWLGYRMPTEDLWRTWLHSPSVRAFETGKIAGDEFARQLIDELQIGVDSNVFLEAFAGWPSGVFPGALELIDQIPRRYVRAVLSNSNAVHWPRVTDELGLGGIFDHYFVSHLTGRIKPDADAFEHVLETVDCRGNEVLFLDDNLLNVEAARRVGLEAFVVQGPEESLRVLQQFGVISTPVP